MFRLLSFAGVFSTPAALSLILSIAACGAHAAGLDALKLQPISDAPAAAAAERQDASAGQAVDPRAEQVRSQLRKTFGKLKAEAMEERIANPELQARQRKAIAKLKAQLGAALEIRGIEIAGTPRQIRGAILEKASNRGTDPKENDYKTARSFLRKQKDLLRLDDPDSEMKATAYRQDDLGRRHFRFEQNYRGLPIWPTELLVQVDPAGNVDALDGAFVPTPRGIAKNPQVSESSALERARREVAGSEKAQAGAGELIIYAPGERPPRLAWKFILELSPAARWLVVIDAVNGAALTAYNQVMEQGVSGSGVDLQGVPRNLNLWQQGGTYYLVDTSKPMFDPGSTPPAQVRGGIEVFDARNQPPTSNPSSNIGDTSLYYVTSGSPGAGWLRDGVSAAFNLSETYDYFRTRHGRNSLDNAGSTMFSIVRYGQGYQNAFYNGQVMAFGDGKPYAAALDVVAHELTHGVTHHTANLEYVDQSGALNEAFSDIFGSAVEAYSRGATDWLLGDALGTPSRNLKDPSSLPICCGRNYPSKMSEYILPTDPFLDNFNGRDNGGVHINSGIVNRAFYLLAEGLSGAIGIGDAERIFYRALAVHLTKRSQFIDARQAAIASAEEIFGAGSIQAQKTAAAFDTVEIYGGASTPNPSPIPSVSGEDSALCVYYNPAVGQYRLCRRETALGDPSQGSNLSAYGAARSKASVSGDGSIAIAVTADHDACLFATSTPLSTSADCLGLPGQISSVAMAPTGDRYAFVFRDSSGNPENAISIIDLNAANPKILTLKGTAEDGQPIDIKYADSMAFTVDGRFLLYDAFNSIRLADNSTIGVWSIYALDTATDRFLTILPPAEGLDITFPAAAHTRTELLGFEVVDQASGISYVFTGNVNSGDIGLIATVNSAYFAVPGFTGDDSALVYSAQDSTNTQTSLWKQPLAASRLAPEGGPSLWLEDAHYGVVYRRGSFSGAAEYTLNLASSGLGTVSSAPAGINCGADCQQVFLQDTIVHLLATPAPGMFFGGWSGCDAVGGSLCTVNMNGNRSLAVQFSSTAPPPVPAPGPTPMPEPTPVPNSSWDLTGSWKNLGQACRGAASARKCRIKGKLAIRNLGTKKVPRSRFSVFLSQDPVLTADDVRVARGAVGAIGRRKTLSKVFNTAFLPKARLAGSHVIAVIDAENQVPEINESNNRIPFGPLP